MGNTWADWRRTRGEYSGGLETYAAGIARADWGRTPRGLLDDAADSLGNTHASTPRIPLGNSPLLRRRQQRDLRREEYTKSCYDAVKKPHGEQTKSDAEKKNKEDRDCELRR